MLNKIFNEDCFETIERIKDNNIKVNIVLTSPPYNTSIIGNKNDKYNVRYDCFKDNMTDDEYINNTINLFNKLDSILKENGVILYNLSYSARKPSLSLKTIYNVINKTNFELVDTIVWKKENAIPDNRSSNRLTRITESIYVLARKNEIKTFQCNKEIVSVTTKNQKNYIPIYNFIEAANNDRNNKLNKATYSTELCSKLLTIYGKENDIVYDPYMGIGTTAMSCIKLNMNYIGSEISKEQVDYFNNIR